MRRCLLYLLLFSLVSAGPHASGLAFDLAGPKVDVRVKRGGETLPIAAVPNIMGGDRLWIHPDLPESQSAHFVLVIAFLRGATNPPPQEWFTRVETWTQSVRSEGVFVNVPAEAQQAVLFLVPETGGDFNTLKKAVHDEPGSFVRAVQDLQAASWDRMRVEAYLAQVKVTSQSDQKTLKERAEMASRSLGVKLEQSCFEKPAEQQAACLAQNPDSMVLDDSNAQSRVAQLTGGSTGDLMNAISSSSVGGSGAYSAYVGAIVDTAKILSQMHTAHFRYIPALALPAADTLNLRLATPPSFRSPKSVVVVALPPMGAVKAPPLHPLNPADKFCAAKPGLLLPAEGAPLVFATEMAHDLVLHIEAPGHSGSAAIDLPLTTDTSKGGLVLAPTGSGHAKVPVWPAGELTGEVRGKWGFDTWTGPRYHLWATGAGSWTLAASDQSALVVGREDTLHLEGESSLCVDRVEAHNEDGSSLKVTWKSPKPDSLELTVPLKNSTPGQVSFSIFQFGQDKPQTLAVKAYSDAASLDKLLINQGDTEAHLKGTRLDEVAGAELEGIAFKPGELGRVGDSDLLTLKTSNSTVKLTPGKRYTAHVELHDGRTLKVAVVVEPPRPRAILVNKGVQQSGSAAVQLGSADDLPLESRLIFFIKSAVPANFPRDSKLEVAAVDGGFRTMLTLADGSLILEDAKTVMGRIEPLERFGTSAFGPIHVRVVAANGIAGDWLPLGTLVRLPGFKELRCPRATAKPCTLMGTNLFFATAFSASQDFANATEVPPEFTGTQINVPRPANNALYLKLRDDPDTVQALTLPITFAAGEAKAASAITPQATSVATRSAATAPATTASEPPAPEVHEQSAPASSTDSTPAEAAKPAVQAQPEAH
ncbi:MAG: hypothetical protein P4K83_11885 [Terracidiphilus sp.]|nr:hypothetical protein [Terracidiphilus sp.]